MLLMSTASGIRMPGATKQKQIVTYKRCMRSCIVVSSPSSNGFSEKSNEQARLVGRHEADRRDPIADRVVLGGSQDHLLVINMKDILDFTVQHPWEAFMLCCTLVCCCAGLGQIGTTHYNGKDED